MPDVSVVVPTINEQVLTRESVPDGVPVIVARGGTLNQARNRGVERAETERVIVLDDDVRFSQEFFWSVVDRIAPDRLVGMADWNYGLIAGRLMAFTKSLWRSVGGFDERLRSHMGDTDFAISAAERGYDIERIPQDE
ncbi:MAG: glycosyltransferase family 2 protein, partial [Halobaculum sp.]